MAHLRETLTDTQLRLLATPIVGLGIDTLFLIASGVNALKGHPTIFSDGPATTLAFLGTPWLFGAAISVGSIWGSKIKDY